MYKQHALVLLVRTSYGWAAAHVFALSNRSSQVESRGAPKTIQLFLIHTKGTIGTVYLHNVNCFKMRTNYASWFTSYMQHHVLSAICIPSHDLPALGTRYTIQLTLSVKSRVLPRIKPVLCHNSCEPATHTRWRTHTHTRTDTNTHFFAAVSRVATTTCMYRTMDTQFSATPVTRRRSVFVYPRGYHSGS